MEEDLATEGILTGKFPKKHQPWLDHGIHVATEVSRLDIGQSVIVSKGTVLAVEAFDGTDALIGYCTKFKTKDAILVKTAKPNQDYRFDVPVFGMRTLEKLNAADIRTAAIAAGSTLLLDKANLLEKAKELKINLVGFAPSEFLHPNRSPWEFFEHLFIRSDQLRFQHVGRSNKLHNLTLKNAEPRPRNYCGGRGHGTQKPQVAPQRVKYLVLPLPLPFPHTLRTLQSHF